MSDKCNATYRPTMTQCALDAGHSPSMHWALGGALKWLDGEGDSSPHVPTVVPDELAKLRESLARVTAERDRAEAAADKWRNDLEQMTAERDEARAQLAAMDIVTGPWGIGTMAIGCTCDRSAEEALKCPVHR